MTQRCICTVSLVVLALLASGFSPVLGEPSAGQQFELVEPQKLLQFAAEQAKVDPILEATITGVLDGFQVLFLPGILGSRLEFRNEHFTYGKDAIKSKSLLYEPNQQVKASVLNTTEVTTSWGLRIGETDVYGEALVWLRRTLGGREPKLWGYDWREDIDVLADRLQEHLETDFKDKKVLIVAHSMGGVVAWHWMTKYTNDRPIKLLGLVVLGSPLEGSCEMVKMLIKGYGSTSNNFFVDLAYQAVFGKAQPAAFTWPSAYELMPHEANCVYFLDNNHALFQNHLEFDFWSGEFGADLAGYAKDLGLKPEDYVGRLRKALGTAIAFHTKFKIDPGGDSVYMLFSSKARMCPSYTLSGRPGAVTLRGTPPTESGDGRVLKSSALAEHARECKGPEKWPLNEQHGNLLSDPSFREFIDEVLQRRFARAESQVLYAQMLQNPKLKEEMISKHWVVDPSTDSDRLRQEFRPELSAIARANVEVARLVEPIGAGGTDVAVASRTGRFLDPSDSAPAGSDAGLAIAFLASEETLGEDRNARTLNRLGLLCLRQKRTVEALQHLSVAAAIADTHRDPLIDDALLAKIHNNAGAANEAAGNLPAALSQYKRAEELGHSTGQASAQRVEAELERVARPGN